MQLFPESISLEDINAHWLPRVDRSLGLSVTEIGPASLTAELKVHEGVVQPHGILHGGVSCVIGESLGSVAGNMCLQDPTKAVVGQNLQALHLRPAPLGTTLIAKAEALHIGRRSQIWETEIKDKANGKLIARITLTVAVIDRA